MLISEGGFKGGAGEPREGGNFRKALKTFQSFREANSFTQSPKVQLLLLVPPGRSGGRTLRFTGVGVTLYGFQRPRAR